MKLIEREWNEFLNKYQHMWIADTEEGITPGFDPDGATGSMIMVISTNATWLKNSEGKWQKVGTTEVI